MLAWDTIWWSPQRQTKNFAQYKLKGDGNLKNSAFSILLMVENQAWSWLQSELWWLWSGDHRPCSGSWWQKRMHLTLRECASHTALLRKRGQDEGSDLASKGKTLLKISGWSFSEHCCQTFLILILLITSSNLLFGEILVSFSYWKKKIREITEELGLSEGRVTQLHVLPCSDQSLWEVSVPLYERLVSCFLRFQIARICRAHEPSRTSLWAPA